MSYALDLLALLLNLAVVLALTVGCGYFLSTLFSSSAWVQSGHTRRRKSGLPDQRTSLISSAIAVSHCLLAWLALFAWNNGGFARTTRNHIGFCRGMFVLIVVWHWLGKAAHLSAFVYRLRSICQGTLSQFNDDPLTRVCLSTDTLKTQSQWPLSLWFIVITVLYCSLLSTVILTFMLSSSLMTAALSDLSLMPSDLLVGDSTSSLSFCTVGWRFTLYSHSRGHPKASLALTAVILVPLLTALMDLLMWLSLGSLLISRLRVFISEDAYIQASNKRRNTAHSLSRANTMDKGTFQSHGQPSAAISGGVSGVAGAVIVGSKKNGDTQGNQGGMTGQSDHSDDDSEANTTNNPTPMVEDRLTVADRLASHSPIQRPVKSPGMGRSELVSSPADGKGGGGSSASSVLKATTDGGFGNLSNHSSVGRDSGSALILSSSRINSQMGVGMVTLEWPRIGDDRHLIEQRIGAMYSPMNLALTSEFSMTATMSVLDLEHPTYDEMSESGGLGARGSFLVPTPHDSMGFLQMSPRNLRVGNTSVDSMIPSPHTRDSEPETTPGPPTHWPLGDIPQGSDDADFPPMMAIMMSRHSSHSVTVTRQGSDSMIGMHTPEGVMDALTPIRGAFLDGGSAAHPSASSSSTSASSSAAAASAHRGPGEQLSIIHDKSISTQKLIAGSEGSGVTTASSSSSATTPADSSSATAATTGVPSLRSSMQSNSTSSSSSGSSSESGSTSTHIDGGTLEHPKNAGGASSSSVKSSTEMTKVTIPPAKKKSKVLRGEGKWDYHHQLWKTHISHDRSGSVMTSSASPGRSARLRRKRHDRSQTVGLPAIEASDYFSSPLPEESEMSPSSRTIASQSEAGLMKVTISSPKRSFALALGKPRVSIKDMKIQGRMEGLAMPAMPEELIVTPTAPSPEQRASAGMDAAVSKRDGMNGEECGPTPDASEGRHSTVDNGLLVPSWDAAMEGSELITDGSTLTSPPSLTSMKLQSQSDSEVDLHTDGVSSVPPLGSIFSASSMNSVSRSLSLRTPQPHAISTVISPCFPDTDPGVGPVTSTILPIVHSFQEMESDQDADHTGEEEVAFAIESAFFPAGSTTMSSNQRTLKRQSTSDGLIKHSASFSPSRAPVASSSLTTHPTPLASASLSKISISAPSAIEVRSKSAPARRTEELLGIAGSSENPSPADSDDSGELTEEEHSELKQAAIAARKGRSTGQRSSSIFAGLANVIPAALRRSTSIQMSSEDVRRAVEKEREKEKRDEQKKREAAAAKRRKAAEAAEKGRQQQVLRRRKQLKTDVKYAAELVKVVRKTSLLIGLCAACSACVWMIVAVYPSLFIIALLTESCVWCINGCFLMFNIPWFGQCYSELYAPMESRLCWFVLNDEVSLIKEKSREYKELTVPGKSTAKSKRGGNSANHNSGAKNGSARKKGSERQARKKGALSSKSGAQKTGAMQPSVQDESVRAAAKKSAVPSKSSQSGSTLMNPTVMMTEPNSKTQLEVPFDSDLTNSPSEEHDQPPANSEQDFELMRTMSTLHSSEEMN